VIRLSRSNHNTAISDFHLIRIPNSGFVSLLHEFAIPFVVNAHLLMPSLLNSESTSQQLSAFCPRKPQRTLETVPANLPYAWSSRIETKRECNSALHKNPIFEENPSQMRDG
jgi:hypothetical protein